MHRLLLNRMISCVHYRHAVMSKSCLSQTSLATVLRYKRKRVWAGWVATVHHVHTCGVPVFNVVYCGTLRLPALRAHPPGFTTCCSICPALDNLVHLLIADASDGRRRNTATNIDPLSSVEQVDSQYVSFYCVTVPLSVLIITAS